MQLEVLVTGAAEAVTAEQAGATRIELVSDPDKGGLTPPPHTIHAVSDAVSIPVHVIVRPHDNGFIYDRGQRKEILAGAARLRDLGASGVVFGALDRKAHVDVEFIQEVVGVSRLPLTFHRAFDATPSLSASYATLAAIDGVERVLTSGGALSAWEGRVRLRELGYGNTAPSIIAGGGIDLEILQQLLQYTGLREYHVGRGARSNGGLDAGKIEQMARLLHARNQR